MISQKLKETYYAYSVHLAELLDRVGLVNPEEISKKIPIGKLPFSIQVFLHQHRNDVVHLGRDRFEIPEINQLFSMSDTGLYSLEAYFREKERMRFIKRGGYVYAQVKNYVFLLPFPFGIFELAETFYDECYGSFDVHGGMVVDIGALIGDSAVYFAGKKAKKVIAFEPNPPMFEIALKNVHLNKLQSIITVRNQAIGQKSGEAMLKYEKSWPGMSSLTNANGDESSGCYSVKVVPLFDVIREFGHTDLLKMDCEGAEWQIIPQAIRDGVFKFVDRVVMEVHGYQPERMETLLKKAGFKVHNQTKGKHAWIIEAIRV